jgi:hypothetical protein
MKKQLKLLAISSLISGSVLAQLDPTAGNSNPNNVQAWSRAGNNQQNGGNVLGTRYNSPIYFITGGVTPNDRRMKLNGIFNGVNQYNINGFGVPQTVNTTGYLLLGQNMNSASGNIYTDLGAFSMLHLNGRDQPGTQEAGYRPWMKTGVTFTDNNDLSYMGVRKLGTGTDRTETVIAWSDNASTGLLGPDDMVFRYTSGGQGNVAISNDLTTPNDLDGRHIARFAPTGEFGLGNTFGVNVGGPAIYVRPQSLLHLSRNDGTSVWSQYTNEVSGQTANNGLRVGLLGRNNPQRNGNALIYQQDNRHLLFSTNADTDNVGPVNTRERMRITSVSAPTALSGGGYGVHNPGNIAANRTRVAISHNPANPVSRPLSLLHLGYNTGSAFLPGTLDGWRPWMDVGMFVAQGTDNMYFGLKDEGNDRFDAIINWGDNQDVAGPFPVGPDNLRFVFTSTTAFGSGDPVSTSDDGLETGRFEPTEDVNGLPDSYGKLGVGDFYTTPLEVTHKLHVRGNGRFEFIPEEGAEHIILGKEIDPSNPNDVSFRRLAFTNDPNDVLLGDGTWGTVTGVGGVLGAHNGTSMSTIDNDLVSFGQDVGDILNPGILLSDREIPMDGFDIQFNGIGIPDGNLVSFGQPNLITGYERSKVHVYNDHENVAISGYTDASTLTPFFSRQFGVSGYITNAESDISAAVHGLAENSAPGMQGTGVFGEASNNTLNIGVRGTVFDDNALANYGGNFGAFGAAQTNYGIFCSAFGATGTDWAGFFGGALFAQSQTIGSDSLLKQNINQLTNATEILNQLKPVTFEFKQDPELERLHLSLENQFGLIAQDVEQILPELITNVTAPAVFDSLGNQMYAPLSFKGLNQEAFIPILIQGFKEQQATVDSLQNELSQKDSLINDVNDRLTQLENCLGNLLPMLCQINNSAIYENNEEAQSELIHTLNLELFDGENIVLEQNIPNPFAERTVINYFLPESVRDAKIIFYSQEGRMINEMNITERGNGRVNVYGADLSKGIYSYTLICDGQVIATKKMVKQ